jgi:hypothetical protein
MNGSISDMRRCYGEDSKVGAVILEKIAQESALP